MSNNSNTKTEPNAEAPLPSPTPLERVTTIERDLSNLNQLLEHLWLERHLLGSAISELRVVRRNVELVRLRLAAGNGGDA